MVGRQMLALIDIQLQQAFSENKNKPFSDRSIILFDDFDQILPVLDLSIYANIKWDELSNSSLITYKHFREVYKLETI